MRTRTVLTSVSAAVLAVGGLTVVAWTQQGRSTQAARQGGQGFPDLAAGLAEIRGCLGVETARTASGKNVVFAWFENKEAVKRWYYSEMHQTVTDMMTAGEDYEGSKPLAHVADDAGPILVVASITMSQTPEIPGVPLPVSQLAIEMYEALPGGIYITGRFAPAGVEFAHMRDFTPKPQETAP